ncbi:MAG: hypothetical protein H6934_02570 [Burkholderiaceae bacterium]|nr:hypothetical protein [Burkholderiaceae bacterium]
MRLIRTDGPGGWTSRLAAVVLFGLLCATLTYWLMQVLPAPARIAPAGSLADQQGRVSLVGANALFGQASGAARPLAPIASTNLRVAGIISGGGLGSALISVDGKPAIAYAVGARIDDATRLAEVTPASVVIERHGERIEIKPPPTADTSVLTSGVGKSRAGAGAPVTSARPAAAPRPPPAARPAQSVARPTRPAPARPIARPATSPARPGASDRR